MLRAFSDSRYDYYELTRPLGEKNYKSERQKYLLPKGAIFVHDKDDDRLGSIANGCLKLCWTPDGSTYGLCGGGMAFHAEFRNTDLFKLVQKGKPEPIHEVEINGIYKHFKGDKYCVVGVSTHTETGEKCVVYKPVDGRYKLYSRPYDMFLSKVDKKKYPDARQEYRFELVE